MDEFNSFTKTVESFEYGTSFFLFYFSVFWGTLPRIFHFFASRTHSFFYSTKLSSWLVPLYIKRQYSDQEYIKKFIPASGEKNYKNFQDFFTRKYKNPLTPKSPYLWPCEGLLCEKKSFLKNSVVSIKGEKKPLYQVFGCYGEEIPPEYFYTNIFLHNCHYHRIHAPTDSYVSGIEHIKGKLHVLRPWAYKNEFSFPAFFNERYIIKLIDHAGAPWYLAIVGGPGVSTIKIHQDLKVASYIKACHEMAMFMIGSTCCMASPYETKIPTGTEVQVGKEYYTKIKTPSALKRSKTLSF